LTPTGRPVVGGLAIDAVDIVGVVETIEEWIQCGSQHVAVGINAHVVNLAARNARLAEILARADMRYPDGQAVVWAARAAGADILERVATTDLAHPLASMCARRGYSMFLFGSELGVAARAAQRLRDASPGLVTHTHHGYVADAEMPVLLEEIQRVRPQILLVGLGDPLQHWWIARHRVDLEVPVVLSCGGLFDWISGDNRRPPQWMVRAGLEWLWRVFLEPRRLLTRYLVGNPEFVGRVAADLVRRRRADASRLRSRTTPDRPA